MTTWPAQRSERSGCSELVSNRVVPRRGMKLSVMMGHIVNITGSPGGPLSRYDPPVDWRRSPIEVWDPDARNRVAAVAMFPVRS